MLKFFRHKNVAKMVLWGILILILPAFVLWGTGNLGRDKDKGPTSVGMINGKRVSFDAFADSVTGVRCHLILNYFDRPKMMDAILKDKAFIGRLAWDRLIMLSEARRNNFTASDKEVVAYLQGHPLFLRNGRFDEGIYAYVLRNNVGLDARTFEEIARENIAINKLSVSITKDVRVSDEEAMKICSVDAEKFGKDKDSCIKKALAVKHEVALEGWLRKAEEGAKLNIDLKEYDKYYR